MNTYSWFTKCSFKQRVWLFATIAGMLSIVMLGSLLNSSHESKATVDFNTDMSIKDVAPQLGITGKSLAREFKLPLDVSKRKPLKDGRCCKRGQRNCPNEQTSGRTPNRHFFHRNFSDAEQNPKIALHLERPRREGM